MSYIDENLMAGERVVFRTRMHWIAFFSPVAMLGFGVWIIGASAMIGSMAVLLGLVLGAAAAADYVSAEYGVTTRRVLIKTGILRRRSVETLLSKVETISVNQGLLGRVLGYGSIVVGGTGGSRETFARVVDPIGLRRHVQEQIEGGTTPRA